MVTQKCFDFILEGPLFWRQVKTHASTPQCCVAFVVLAAKYPRTPSIKARQQK
jgi:hypothetical protein